jgi:NADPH-dependent 2,4-dienoyl-CoA reductase/sulfur reductase-like enzyme
VNDDKLIPADFVIVGAGVNPATKFLKSSGVKLDEDGGISVDGSMRVPNVDGVFAVGDVARYEYHITGENVRIEHWNVAQNQGRIAAQTIMAKITSKESPKFNQIPYFWTVQYGKSIRYVGYASSYD